MLSTATLLPNWILDDKENVADLEYSRCNMIMLNFAVICAPKRDNGIYVTHGWIQRYRPAAPPFEALYIIIFEVPSLSLSEPTV